MLEPTSPPNAKGLIDPNWVCATKFNETRIGRRAINVAAAVLGGFALVSGLTVIGVVLFYYCRCHKGKLKVKEEANDTDTESDADIRPPYKTHYRQANRDLTSTHILSSLGRTVSILVSAT